MEKKRIGIVTMWDSDDNYGQVLQCYALQRYLRDRGHDAFLIRAISDTMSKSSICRRLLELPSKMLNSNFWQLLYFRFKLRKFNQKHGNITRHFDKFKATHIESTSDIYCIDRLMKDPPQADVYIAGSDQIWGAPSRLYFLEFVPKRCKRYSYAASFGNNHFSQDGVAQMKSALAQFSDVTVREESGVCCCAEMGIDSTKVIDPTGLIDPNQYRTLFLPDLRVAEKQSKYILLYLLGNYTRVNIAKIYNYAKLNNLEIKYIASQGRNDKYKKVFPSPIEWLQLIDNAEFVLTNSYHCCMFSMYFKKKFIALRLFGAFAKMNSRIDTLISTYSIPIARDLEELNDITFDYEKISSKLNRDRMCGVRKITDWEL